jgi:hypothetical protein
MFLKGGSVPMLLACMLGTAHMQGVASSILVGQLVGQSASQPAAMLGLTNVQILS